MYTTMKNKYKAAQDKYKDNNEHNEKMKQFTIEKEFPQEKLFMNYDTFVKDFAIYISKFRHSDIPMPKTVIPYTTSPISAMREYAITKLSYINQFFIILYVIMVRNCEQH